MWLIFYVLLRKTYLHYKVQIKKGEMWVLRMTYTYFYGVMVKTHESMFGLMCYGLLMQFSCLTFTNILGIFSFIAAVMLLAYLIFNTVNLYKKLNG
jgi:hypothetical protein